MTPAHRVFLIKAFAAILVLVVCTSLSTALLGVGTSHWTQQSESEFKDGSFDNVVATNLNQLKLSRSVKTILSQDPRVSAVYAMAEGPDGTIYAGTGPQGVLLAIKDGIVKTVAVFGNDQNIFSLLFDPQGRLLIGTGGENGKIFRVDHPEKSTPPTTTKTVDGATSHPTSQPIGDELFSSTGVQYIWAMTQSPDGTTYAATGPNGQLFSIDPAGKSKVLFECDENNLLSLITDNKDFLYAGTDPNGLVYRINRKTGDAFILYDATESEVRSLALDSGGNLYAATGDAAEPSKMSAESTDSTERVGHPENPGAPANPLPSQPPTSPKPPELPTPAPGEPNPIPRSAPTHSPTTRALSLMDDPGDAPGGGAGGDPNAPGDPNTPPEPQANPLMPVAPPAQAGQPSDIQSKGANGNAVYRITPEGFVTEVFRQPVTIYSMIESGGTLLVGTGREGTVYQIDPAAEETVSIAKVDPKDVLCLLRAHDGQVWMGLANGGQVASLQSGFAATGTFVSPPLDAKQISRFGKIHLRGSLPGNSSLTIATRSGNVGDPANKGWSKWSPEAPATEYVSVAAQSARYLQYRLTFNSTDGKQTPIVDSITTGYQTPNLAPVIHSLKVGAGSPGKPPAEPAAEPDTSTAAIPAPSPSKNITWDASDPNGDALKFSIYFRTGQGEQTPGGGWILLKDKVIDNNFDWNTRDVADGRYQIKLVASDAAANPLGQGKTATRVSDEILVNNAAPSIGDLKVTPGTANGKGEAKIAARVTDRWGTVAAVAYSVDSANDWQAVLPLDTVADSPEESYDFTVKDLLPGPHQITLRATDSQGNQAYTTVTVTGGASDKSVGPTTRETR